MKGVPEFLTLPDKQQSDLAIIFKDKIRDNKVNAAAAKSRAAD